MEIKTDRKEGFTLLRLKGSLDADSVALFKKAAYKMVEEGTKHLVVDCHGLDFIDSMGLGAMISLLRRVKTQQGSLKISGLNTDVRSVFEITRLNHLFEIFPDWQSACRESP